MLGNNVHSCFYVTNKRTHLAYKYKSTKDSKLNQYYNIAQKLWQMKFSLDSHVHPVLLFLSEIEVIGA